MHTKVFLLSLLLSLGALAAPKVDPTVKARAAFQAAQQLYQADKFAAALEKFQEAQALKPHPVILFNIARCHEQLGATREALAAYREYLKQLPTASDKDAVEASIATLEKKLGPQVLTVAVEPNLSAVKVDGKLISGNPPTVELKEGEHTLEVSAQGYETFRRTFTIGGKPLDMNVALRAMPSDAPKNAQLTPDQPPPLPPLVAQQPDAPRARTATWIVGGTAIAAAGGALGLGLAAQGQAATIRGQMVRDGALVERDAQAAQNLALGSNIAWGVAGAAAITAVILYFVEGAPAKTP